MNWENKVHGSTYPVGNVHLPYYEDVSEYFVDRGLEPEDSHVVTVGSNLIGWWLKNQYPEAEVTTVEVNPRTSYLQDFASDYLSEPEEDRSVEELKGLIGITDPSTGIPGFVEDGETPEDIMKEHKEYVERQETNFDEVPDFSQIGFAWKDFYPEILDEIGFNTQRPENQMIGDFREQDIPEADAVYTNNVIDTVVKESFYEGLEDMMKDDAYIELVSEPGGRPLGKEFSGLQREMNPDVGFWWRPSPEEKKQKEDYMPLIALYTPET